jgi:hypothetical protein
MGALRTNNTSTSLKRFTLLILVAFAAIFLDMIFADSSTVVSLSSDIFILSFIVLASLFVVTQYGLIKYIDHIRSKINYLNSIHRAIFATQYIFVAILILLIIQITFSRSYSTEFLIFGSDISYAVSSFLMAMLASKFLSWYRSTRNSVILLYGLASCTACVALVALLVFYHASLSLLPHERTPLSEAPLQFYDPSSAMGALQYLTAVLSFIPPLLFWTSTAALLKHYSKRVGKVRFWIVMSIPIVFIISQPVIVAPLIYVATDPSVNPIHVTVLGNMLPGIIGGIIYGIPFLLVSRTLRSETSDLQKYMVVAGFGFILSTVSLQMSVESAPYPPFGLVTVFFVVITSYMILVGLYSSAISVSHNADLRRSIRKYVLQEVRFLDSIGSAHMEKEIEQKAVEVAKKIGSQGQESELSSYADDKDIREYVEEVMDEMKKLKRID